MAVDSIDRVLDCMRLCRQRPPREVLVLSVSGGYGFIQLECMRDWFIL